MCGARMTELAVDGRPARAVATPGRLPRAARTELMETGDLEVAVVARRVGVSGGLPYRHFGTRSGLLIAVELVVEHLWTSIAGPVGPPAAAGPTPAPPRTRSKEIDPR